jgi:hypothetical protein
VPTAPFNIVRGIGARSLAARLVGRAFVKQYSHAVVELQ